MLIFFILADADLAADIYFQYLRMQMLKVMRISGQDVDFFIFTDVDIYFRDLRMRMLKIIQISGPPLDIGPSESMAILRFVT